MNPNPTTVPKSRGFSRRAATILAATAIAFALGCQADGPTGLDPAAGGLELAGKGKPVRCDAGTDVLLTLRDDPGDALTSDQGGAYAAHTAGNGNLMLWTEGTGRYVNVVTTAFSGTTTDRIYTNTHRLDDGADLPCGLDQMPVGGVGSANFVVELGDGNDIVRYGTDCSGNEANRVAVTRSPDGSTWTITGTSGVQCRTTGKGRKATTEQVGTAGAFGMTLVGQ